MGEDRFSVIQMTENDETFMEYDMTGFLDYDSQDSEEGKEMPDRDNSDLPRLFKDITNDSPSKVNEEEKPKKDKKKKKENKEKKEKKSKKEKKDKKEKIVLEQEDSLGNYEMIGI